MNLPIQFKSIAKAEFDEAVDWYEIRRSGLGTKFARAVREVLELISSAPTIHAKVLDDVREAIVPRYPYCVYYSEETTRIIVWAVFHTSRDPAVWQRRV